MISSYTQNNYEIAFQNALNILNNSVLEEVCLRTGARTPGARTSGARMPGARMPGSSSSGGIISDHNLELTYFNREYRIALPGGEFSPSGLKKSEQILILHYLTIQKNYPTSGKYVSFKGLPNGMFYYTAYRKRGPARILQRFADNPGEIYSAASPLDAQKADFGDVAVVIRVLPNIEACIAYYAGDDEFPPDAEILFRDKVINFLDLEDIAVIAGKIVDKICNN